MLADIYRRSGLFARAIAVCEQVLAAPLDADLEAVLRAEIRFARAGDAGAHEVSEVVH